VQTVTVDEERDALSAIVDQVAPSRDVVTITKRVEPAAVYPGLDTGRGRHRPAGGVRRKEFGLGQALR